MTSIIQRKADIENIKNLLNLFPVVAILGARQCGKTTIARQFEFDHYFDLENPRDLARLDQPQLALENLRGLIVIDEIQRTAELFPLLRFLVDTIAGQKYLILGSASRDLIKQSSESLAGRIGYYYLSGFSPNDIGYENINKLWLRGALPRSVLAESEKESYLWRESYITTFLERDIPQLGIQIPSNTLRRFWTMLSHYHGQTLNFSEIGRAFGISDVTIRKYVEILEGTFMIRVLQPWFVNIGKRIVKKPKIYFRDSGIFHSLQFIEKIEQLHSSNKLGASWEGFALEIVCRAIQKKNVPVYFWGTHWGAEVDLFWENAGKNWAAEFKYMDAPKITKSMQIATTDLNLTRLWIVYPGRENYQLTSNISVVSLEEFQKETTNFN